jgi:hypothetical protein
MAGGALIWAVPFTYVPQIRTFKGDPCAVN